MSRIIDDLPDRKLNRKRDFNYNQKGDYFVTIDAYKMKEYFGKVVNGEMILNEYGKIAQKYWGLIPRFYKNVRLNVSVVMPNHVHGIIEILSDVIGQGDLCETEGQNSVLSVRYGLLSKIVKSFKEAVVKEIRGKYGDYDFKWQRSFHDQIIRDREDLERIKKYIINNPINWKK